MDIHHEADQILANLQQNQQQLRFEFHPGGATVILSNSAGEHKYELAPHDLLRLGIESHYLFRMMQLGTVSYFTEEPQP